MLPYHLRFTSVNWEHYLVRPRELCLPIIRALPWPTRNITSLILGQWSCPRAFSSDRYFGQSRALPSLVIGQWSRPRAFTASNYVSPSLRGNFPTYGATSQLTGNFPTYREVSQLTGRLPNLRESQQSTSC